MPQEFYKEEEAEQILRLATQQSLSGGLSREALLRTAAEVGLSEEQVFAAEKQFHDKESNLRLAERFTQRQQARFVGELASYGGISALMIGVWWMGGAGYFWPGWWLVFAVVGGFDEIPKCLMQGSSSYQKAFARWKAKGAPEVDPEADQDERGRSKRVRARVLERRNDRRDRF